MTWPFHPLLRSAYSVLIADPPWRFVTWSQTRQYKAPSRHYAVMELEQIKSLPVAELAAPDCLLWLWATQAQLHQAFAVMQCWGFEFKTAGAWAKQSPTGASWAFGTGYVLRSAAEFWLIGTRGKPKPDSRSERNLIVAPVREHSRKPDQAYEMLERMFPAQRRCELFARYSRPGWDQWGLEIEGAQYEQRLQRVCEGLRRRDRNNEEGSKSDPRIYKQVCTVGEEGAQRGVAGTKEAVSGAGPEEEGICGEVVLMDD